MKKTSNGIRLISIFLAAAIILQMPAPALAYMVKGRETASGVTFTDSDGNIQEADESWEETFPYGAFAFEKSGLVIDEGESDIIKVYRLGGSTGRATAYITYEPLLIKGEDGKVIYDNAISSADLDIAVEEPQPVAKYQPVGRPQAPASGKAEVIAEPDEAGYILKLSQEADSYQWQVLYKGSWQDIIDAEDAQMPMDAEYAEGSDYDYRCLYEYDGIRYCSVSMTGERYWPEEEDLPDMPSGIELNADPVYTKLNLRGEGEEAYAGWAFELIFADGEWVKEIHIDTFTDRLSEAQEAATFTIRDCEGGEVLEAANTLLMSITDKNEPEPSTLSFVLSEVSADKAEGKVKVMVERVGGNQRPVTIKYTSVDGTALAGKDYESTESMLMFYAGVNKLPATIELIDDGVAADEPVYFDIVLYELLGDDKCTLTGATARVNLTNSGTPPEYINMPNLASQVYDPELVDVSGTVTEAEGAANSAAKVVSGRTVPLEEPEGAEADLVFGGEGDMSPQVYKVPNLAAIKFNNPANAWGSIVDAAVKDYWQADLKGEKEDAGFAGGNNENLYIGKDPNGGEYVKINTGIALYSKNKADASMTETGWGKIGGSPYVASQLFNYYDISIDGRMGHDTSYLGGSTRYYSYTHPKLSFAYSGESNGSLVANPQYVKHFVLSGTGAFDKEWAVRASDDNVNFYNPFQKNYSGNIDIGLGKLSLSMSLYFHGTGSHEQDRLNDASMIWLKQAKLTRRTFAKDAFKLEISTPNDINTAPENTAVITDYTKFKPKVEILEGLGGVNSDNRLYVGSTVKISTESAPAGYYISDLVIYQSLDNGLNWNVFRKFVNPSYNSADRSYKVKLVGKENGASPLKTSDISAQYKFRIVYSRGGSVTVDLSPSVPRKEGSPAEIDTSRIGQVLTGYTGGSSYGFSAGTGVGRNITYACSKFDENLGDFNTHVTEKSFSKPTDGSLLSGNKQTEITFSDTNIQWVNFNLPAEDLLLINGTTYPGNAKIYLKESDFAGGLSVLYYHKDYQTAQSAMKTAISWMGLYWDANGNGMIDGYYKEDDSTFVLTGAEPDGEKDRFWGYINAESVNERMFAPIKNSDGLYCQFFIKVCYTMTPRSLVLPEGADIGERAQILPAFITAVNPDSAAYSKLTPETRAYRYIVSGLTRQRSSITEPARSSDGHIKYGTEANEKNILDLPLGGDFSPAELSADGKSYTWEPVFRGNILYPFAAPEPLVIENSLAGPTPVTKKYRIERDADNAVIGYTYEGDGLDRMNGYLSSFTGSTSFAMVSQEQKKTTEEILQKMRPGVSLGGGAAGASDDKMYVQAEDLLTYGVLPDSVTLGMYACTPDSEYLKETESEKENSPAPNVNMDESPNEMTEFNMDLGINLGSFDIPVTDFVTILLDGNKVGFAIGLPLGSIDLLDKSASKSPIDQNKEAFSKFSDFFNGSDKGLRTDDSYKKAADEKKMVDDKNDIESFAALLTGKEPPPLQKPDASKFQNKSFSVEFSFQLAFMFEYNPLDNGYYFEGMTAAFNASLSFRYQQRFAPFPLAYFYFQFNGSVKVSLGLGVIRDSIEEGTKLIDAMKAEQEKARIKLTYMTKEEYDDLPAAEQDGYTRSYSFKTKYKAFNLRFKGKMSVEVYTGSDTAGWYPAADDSGYIGGFLSSDGTSNTQVVLKKQNGMEFDKEVMVVLRPLNHDDLISKDITEISYLARITGIRNEVYFQGVKISPAVCVEAGLGMGVEMLKVEAYFKIGLQATLVFGMFNKNYLHDPSVNKYRPAAVESFGFSLGIGLRIVALCFTFELDAVSYKVDYSDDEGWKYGWHFLNDWVKQDASEEGPSGVIIKPPQNFAKRQKLYAPEDNASSEMGTQAYDPTDTNVPFQLSGYGSSFDAAKLAEGLIYGGDYKVISAGERDFILYTISRSDDTGSAEDAPQLVLSELTLKNIAQPNEPAVYKYGMAHPDGKNNSGDIYMILDNDDTGDLDFDLWADESTSGEITTYTINAAWVSYNNVTTAGAIVSKPVKPGQPYYAVTSSSALTGSAILMNADNYKEIPKPVPSDDDYELYWDWYDYYEALEIYYGNEDTGAQARLKKAARNTVLKYAAWSYRSEKTYVTEEGESAEANPLIEDDAGFTSPVRVHGDGIGSMDETGYLFVPSGSGEAIFFGSTLTQDHEDLQYEKYEKFLKNTGKKNSTYGDYLLSTKKSYLDIFGTQSGLNFACKTSEGWQISPLALSEGQTLSNVEFTRLKDDAYYAAYTTRQDAYEESGGKIMEHVTVERLFLRKVTIDSSGKVSWGAPYLLRMTKDYDENNNKDGIYNTASSEPLEAYGSPYFSNLGFLTAKIDSDKLTGTEETFTAMDAEAEHTFLLFEMNGATYIILDDSLINIVDKGKGTIHPFFTGADHINADGSKIQEASGKSEVTIGTDGAGGIFAVYVGTVPNTTNNALYLSAYDPETNSWGDGLILAMRNMDTYEASIRYNWGKKTSQAAYLGFRGQGSTKTGGLLDERDAENLFGDAKDDIFRNLKDHPDDMGDKNNLIFSDLQATKRAGGELLIVTRGSLTELEIKDYEGTSGREYLVMPTYKNGGMESSSGMYAISYSKGSAKLGQGIITFSQPDFSVGSILCVEVNAMNTGDTAFRGSKEQPISASLTANGQELAKWKIESNIRSGQKMVLNGYCSPLLADLPEGAKFTLKLSEDEEYASSAQSAELDLFTVENYPDLALEDLSLSLAGISADGSQTSLNIGFRAANQGSGDASGVYAQFTYADGKDENGRSTYSVLDLRDSKLEINQEQLLETLTASENNAANLKQGILYIYNAADGNNDLKKGYGRRVQGTIKVPSSAFSAGQAGYLDLKIELFTGSDLISGMDAGVVQAEHEEYYSANNAANKAIQAYTNYRVAPSIVIPLGTTTLIPVTAVSSRGTKPALSVTEIDDITDGLNLGILNFKQAGTPSGGSLSGLLSITPSKAGSGVIHIYDAETESQTAVAFIVTDSEDGIDIFVDNEAFTFINSDGSPYDPEGIGHQSWLFNSAPTWGSGADKETPLRSNLSMGEQGAVFTFTTVAEKIYLYFQGRVTVDSDYPGYTPKTYTNDVGGKTPTEIPFGENENYAAFSVNVRVDSPNASFDRLTEKYSGGVVPLPEYDGQNPMFIWSRSFPATASVKSDTGALPLSLYVLDNNGLQYISINGKQYDAGNSSVTAIKEGLLWSYDFGDIASNGTYNIIAKDISGNIASTVLMADWFHESPSGNPATVNVPLYDADFYIGGTILSLPVNKDNIENLNISFKEMTGNEKEADNTHQVYFFDGSEFAKLDTSTPEEPAVFGISANGIYWTRTLNIDGTWSAKVLCMDSIDVNIPKVFMEFNPADNTLLWQAYKDTASLLGEAAAIDTVTINGFKVNRGTSKNHSGIFPVRYSGVYELRAKDTFENEITSKTTVLKLDIDLSTCALTSAASTNPDRNRGNGTIRADLTNAWGGAYNLSDSKEEDNEYYARYGMTLVAGSYNLDNLEDDPTLKWQEMYKDNFIHQYEELNPGDYRIVVRDKSDNSNYASMSVTVADEVPHVQISFEKGLLSWQAYKTTGDIAISNVTINGYKVNSLEGLNLSGTLPVSCCGSYELEAEDVDGNRELTVITVPAWGIDLSNCEIIPNESWNQDRNKGYIRADLTNAEGAAYNTDDSAEENNEYYARYRMTLVAGDYDTDIPGWETGLVWNDKSKDEGFVHTYEGLAPGDYKLIVTDAADSNNKTYAMLTVTDAVLSAEAESINAGRYNDGQIIVAAEGGNTEGFEFALMPIEAPASGKLFTIADFLALDSAESTEDDIVWSLADNVSLDPNKKTFADLTGGWYLAAVRGLYGVRGEKFAELAALRTSLEDAQLDFESAQVPTEEQKNTLEGVKAAYDSKALEIQELCAAAYLDFEEYWDGAFVLAIKVNVPGKSTGGNLSRIVEEAGGAAVYTLISPGKPLTEADMESIRAANKESDVIISGGGLMLRIPKGTLRGKFDVNRMIVDLTGAAEGKLVQYTDLDGNVSILPWCLVSGESVSYLIVGLGDYMLSDKPVNFDDIEGEWGAEYIIFTAARNLFSGTGENTFSPHIPMTRAMFVTVLWRLAGAPRAEGDQPFNDLSADWYGDAVLWAVQKGIAGGYSPEIFGPDDIVSREQMCVFLSRFLKYLGMELDADDRDLTFDDDGKISSWASEYVYLCAKTGLIQGVGENTFDPQRGASRMEVSTILTRFITEVVKKYCRK